jgi:hypothetical protein
MQLRLKHVQFIIHQVTAAGFELKFRQGFMSI